jgi:hypothetical protein
MLKISKSKSRRRGVELIEFTLVLLPMLAFVFLLIDLSWAVFKRATLQFAVREGCRYAVTNQVQNLTDASGNHYGLLDSVKWVVQKRALGFLGSGPTAPGWAAIQVKLYPSSGSLTTALPLPLTCADVTTKPNAGGTNLVEVSVENYQSGALAPLLRSAAPLNFVARSSDRMEGDPKSGVPKLLTCP